MIVPIMISPPALPIKIKKRNPKNGWVITSKGIETYIIGDLKTLTINITTPDSTKAIPTMKNAANTAQRAIKNPIIIKLKKITPINIPIEYWLPFLV